MKEHAGKTGGNAVCMCVLNIRGPGQSADPTAAYGLFYLFAGISSRRTVAAEFSVQRKYSDILKYAILLRWRVHESLFVHIPVSVYPGGV